MKAKGAKYTSMASKEKMESSSMKMKEYGMKKTAKKAVAKKKK